MTIEKVASNSVLVHWTEPEESIFSEYAIRYRTESDKQWVRLSAVKVIIKYNCVICSTNINY